MLFTTDNSLDKILHGLFEPYAKRVTDVKKTTAAMIKNGLINNQTDIINDHVAFRTLGVPHLGIASLERIFLHYGYTKQEHYYFDQKKLDGFWYKPPAEKYPRVFISELKVDMLSDDTQSIISKYTKEVKRDPIDDIDLNDPNAVIDFLHQHIWPLPTWEEYYHILAESEYGAWVIYNRYYLNHYTISVHALPAPFNNLAAFNDLLKSIGVILNNAGGEIKSSADGLLRQSSTVSQAVTAVFKDGDKHEISGSYVEFAERAILPQYAHLPKDKIEGLHRRDGFEVSSADKIFESTFQNQALRKK